MALTESIRFPKLRQEITWVALDALSFEYDALGRRVSIDDSAGTKILVCAGQQLIATYASGAPASSPNQTFVYGSYIDEPILLENGSQRYYFSRNQQFSVTALTDNTGAVVERYAYDAYGNTEVLSATGASLNDSAVGNPFMYTGRFHHPALDLTYFRARYYNSSTGRFAGRDPLGYVDGMSLYQAYFVPGTLDPWGLLSLSSETEATWPENRERTTVGVGEYVVITAEEDTGCSVRSWNSFGDPVNHRFTNPNSFEMARLFVGETAGQVRITAVDDCDCEASIVFTVVEPSGVNHRKIAGNTQHIQGLATAGFLALFEITPNNVSFQNVEFREQEAVTITEGLFAWQASIYGAPPHPVGRWWGVHPGNIGKLVDRIYNGVRARNVAYSDGSHVWNIPYEYRVLGEFSSGTAYTFATVQQKTTVNSVGTVTISKGGSSFTAELDDPSTSFQPVDLTPFLPR